MADKDLVRYSEGNRRDALVDIDDRFKVSESVEHLRKMMQQVTEKEVNADTVNAACNCVSNINSTIKTVIQAARFLSHS